jgi:hypothetical protein
LVIDNYLDIGLPAVGGDLVIGIYFLSLIIKKMGIAGILVSPFLFRKSPLSPFNKEGLGD